MRDFQDVIMFSRLMDLTYVGPLFTWTNNQEGNHIGKKLDMVLVNGYWLSEFPHSFSTFEPGGVGPHAILGTTVLGTTEDVP